MKITDFERANVLRGVHFGPGTSCGFDIGWWVEFLKSMHIGWVKIVDDAGSMMEFARACREAGIMPIIRLYRQYPYPGRLREKDWVALQGYLDRGITRWIETGNEPNLWDVEHHREHRPVKQEGVAIIGTPWFKDAAATAAIDWLLDAEIIVAKGGYPAFPAMAQCADHGDCSSLAWYREMFNHLATYYHERTEKVFERGGWLAVHDATLNHFYRGQGGQWHFEYPYDPVCQAAHPGRTIMQDDNSLIGHEAPRDMIYERWGLRLPIISTEGGIFLNVGKQWDHKYPPIVSAEYHGEATLAMFDWLDEYQKTHPWFVGMCPWLVGESVLGHRSIWDHEAWKKLDREEPVVRWLQGSPPRDLNVPAPPPGPEPTPGPGPIPDPEPPSPAQGEFPRPPKDNGLGIHAGLELTEDTIAQDIVWMKPLGITWATVAYTNEEAMLRAARALWAAGIMPICRWVGNISRTYDFARDTRLLLAEGIPAYIQIFNEPSDPREWKDGTPDEYIARWADLWVQKAGEVVAAGGLPGLQCLHPEELRAVFVRLPHESPIWDRVWFCSHNYGLNHPPDWKEDYWSVLGWQVFAEMFAKFLGFVPPIICGEGGWLYGAYDDHRYPRVDDELHAQYHEEMCGWFLTGELSDGNPTPDYLFAVCPWILSGPSDEAWFGFTERVETIKAIQEMPEFVRGETVTPEPSPPEPSPPEPVSPDGEIEYVGLTDEMKGMLIVEPPANPTEPYWRVKRVEIQPETQKQSVYGILPPGTPFRMKVFWPHGETEWATPKADPYEPVGARAWAASQPLFKGGWGSYGIRLDVNSETLNGIGLYQRHDGKIQPSMSGHHPTLVFFQLVQPEEQPEPEPEPGPQPEPGPEPEKELTFPEACRLCGLEINDLRGELQKYARVDRIVKRQPRDPMGIVVHYTASDLPTQTAESIAEYHTRAKAQGGRGYDVIAYTILVDFEAEAQWCAPFRWVTRHTHSDKVNGETISISVMGLTQITRAQVETVQKLIMAFGLWLSNKRAGPAVRPYVVPHRWISDTACPGPLMGMLPWVGGETALDLNIDFREV